MKLLTSLLSIIFTLILFGALIAVSMLTIIPAFGNETISQVNLLWPLLFIISNWILFRFFDWTYKKLRPKAYTAAWHENIPDFTFIQSIISALRSATLSLAVPTIALLVLAAFLIPPLFATSIGTDDTTQLFYFAIIQLLVIGIWGRILEWRYDKNIQQLMMEKSSTRKKRSTTQVKTISKSRALNFRIFEATKLVKLSKAGAEKIKTAKRIRRSAWLRDIIAPVIALVGMLTMAIYWKIDIAVNKTTIGFVIIWFTLFLVSWISTKFRLIDRAPLRQFRLGFGFFFHALLVLIISPLLLIVEMTGRHGQPKKQWSIIPASGQWVSRFLRSPRLFWIPVILLGSLFLIAGMKGGFESLSPIVLSIFIVGVIAFEIAYRFLSLFVKNRKNKSNRLVFLRVFGDARTGQFLFTNVAPRWKGLGTITCIAAHDVSVYQLEPDIGFDILLGRLRQRFLTRNEAEVIGRHIDSEKFGDVWEDHCFDDSWKAAVETMLTQNAIVMMDLRGFTPQRKGCIYELGVLRDHMPMVCVVFLIDDSTDFEFFTKTIKELWKTMSTRSPNASRGEVGFEKNHQIKIFRMSDSKKQSANQLSTLLVEACVENESHHQLTGKGLLEQLIEDLQLLAADVEVQVNAVGGRTPGKKVLEAAYSCDHDLGFTSYLSSWGMLTDQQDNELDVVNDLAQEIRNNSTKFTKTEMSNNPNWEQLRIAARKSLKALGKRRRAPKTLKS